MQYKVQKIVKGQTWCNKKYRKQRGDACCLCADQNAAPVDGDRLREQDDGKDEDDDSDDEEEESEMESDDEEIPEANDRGGEEGTVGLTAVE